MTDSTVRKYCARCDALFDGATCYRCGGTVSSGWAYIAGLYNKYAGGGDDAITDSDYKTPLTGQVGGNHYKTMAIQPAEYTTKNGIGHLAGDAIAYISRYRAKNGREDLEKAIHSIQLLIELEYGE